MMFGVDHIEIADWIFYLMRLSPTDYAPQAPSVSATSLCRVSVKRQSFTDAQLWKKIETAA